MKSIWIRTAVTALCDNKGKLPPVSVALETADKMNEVRKRAGLEAVAWDLDALKDERMYEFAFEGLRWFDLVRWGDVASSNNYYGDHITVKNNTESTNYSVTYPVNTKGLVSIPESEIRLSNDVYKQNPGW